MSDRPTTRGSDQASQAEAAAAFGPLLAAHTPFFDHLVQWPRVRLHVRAYAAVVPVPEVMVTSVRAVVFKGSSVVVLREADGVRHVMPGGKREPGESLDATLRRELLEECGWHVGELTPFAFLHFQDPDPAPPDWCDFANLIYLAEAVGHDRGALDRSQGDVRSRLMPLKAAFDTVTDRHRVILAAAVSARAASLGER